MRLIADEVLITKYQRIMEERILEASNHKINCNVGYPGGSLDAEVMWLEDLGIWYYPRELDNKYWNAFGMTKPKEGKGVSITGEINFPLEGVNRSINSAFVENDDKVFIIHRGRMGGGKPGVDQSLFRNNYRGEWYEFIDNDKISTGALVGSLFSVDFAAQIAQFIKEYSRIKNLGGQPVQDTDPDDDGFSKEFGGKRRGYTVSDIIEANCNHGIVVNSCVEYLKSKGFAVKNDVNRDLVLLDSLNRERAIFEFKTDLSTTSLYCAIGQLYFHKRIESIKPVYIMVLPEGQVSKIKNKLRELQIELITYELSEGKVSFIGLNNLLANIT
ncbi:hypothetical protein SAMN03159341_13221 [Paenibacillus sp. 1_12]|uniref:hypothetical protein n=1 Tax=Paenibacillus sp. 1_12 TaxID=1566278 RepID=UPI0008DF5E2A|nr:hypothetical protein [Paenibacillus sp. 1_12]SFM42108.1 hypothetical protein SAMN03159341_13221 [Paenibacillus sp. 1_12]